MSLLREQFIRELVIRGMSVRTQETYVYWVHQLAKYYHLSPDRLSGDQLKDFLLHLVEQRKLVSSTLNQAASALRCFYQLVLHRPLDEVKLNVPRYRGATRRPQVFSLEEIERLLTVGCPHPKHRAFLMTVYGAGLRLNEACHLKVEDLNSERQQIRVQQGKGRNYAKVVIMQRNFIGGLKRRDCSVANFT